MLKIVHRGTRRGRYLSFFEHVFALSPSLHKLSVRHDADTLLGTLPPRQHRAAQITLAAWLGASVLRVHPCECESVCYCDDRMRRRRACHYAALCVRSQ